MRKRGFTSYISYILLVAFVVGLSAVMYSYFNGEANKSKDALQYSTKNVLCDELSLDVSGCQDLGQLYLNITNTNQLHIRELRLRMLDIYDEPSSKTIHVVVPAFDEEKVAVLKQGTLGQVKVTPVTIDNKKKIICEQSSIILEKVRQC